MSTLCLTICIVAIVVIGGTGGSKLTDLPHEINGEHNEHYDHEIFLGKDEAEKFEKLSVEESKKRLAIIVDKIDHNNDTNITEEELKDWIWYVRMRFLKKNTDRIWNIQEREDGKLTWKAYQRRTFGYEEDPESVHSPSHQYKDRIEKEYRRWKAADTDNDNKLTKNEFVYFLHPEESEQTKGVMVQETLESLDKDNDGFLSSDEFASWHEKDPRTKDPKFIKARKDEFENYRDTNKDGKLDHDEIMHWILPTDYNPAVAEAKHLVHRADGNGDGVLTKSEILDHHNLFVGSQATDFGDALTKHDEF